MAPPFIVSTSLPTYLKFKRKFSPPRSDNCLASPDELIIYNRVTLEFPIDLGKEDKSSISCVI